LADAVATGTVNTAQIAAIGNAPSDVPDNEPVLVDKVEAALLGESVRFEPTIFAEAR